MVVTIALAISMAIAEIESDSGEIRADIGSDTHVSSAGRESMPGEEGVLVTAM